MEASKADGYTPSACSTGGFPRHPPAFKTAEKKSTSLCQVTQGVEAFFFAVIVHTLRQISLELSKLERKFE